MSLFSGKRGRPYYVAQIPIEIDREFALMDEFYSVTRTFHYREIVALARAFNFSPATVHNWKYGITFPKWQIAQNVIDWDRNGRPMNKVYQKDNLSSLLR